MTLNRKILLVLTFLAFILTGCTPGLASPASEEQQIIESTTPNAPIKTNTPSPTGTPTPASWQSVYPLEDFEVNVYEERDIHSYLFYLMEDDSTYVVDHFKEDDSDGYPKVNDPYIERVLGDSVYLDVDSTYNKFGRATFGCPDCNEDKTDDPNKQALLNSASNVEVCYLAERTYDKYGLINRWIFALSLGEYSMFDDLYPYADNAFVDELSAELQSYEIHSPLWMREAMTPEEVDHYQQLLAPYVLAWILDRMPSCENMVYLSQLIEEEIVQSYTPTATEYYEIEYTVNGWPVISGMEFEDISVTRPEQESLNAGHILAIYFSRADSRVSPISAYILGKDLPQDLQLFIEEIYLEDGMELSIHRSSPDSPGGIFSEAFREEIDSTHAIYSASSYAWDRLTSLQICQFAEASTIRGYGFVTEDDITIVEAFEELIYLYGRDFETRYFYCPNFDPDSPMFLLILQELGYHGLVEELRGSERRSN